MSDLHSAALIFFTALMPTLGSTVAIPMGIVLGIHPVATTVLAVTGALFKVPLALYLAARFRTLGDRVSWLAVRLERVEAQARIRMPLVRRWGWPALIICAAIPVPGFGIWPAALIGRLLGFSRLATGLALGVGLVIAGTGVALASLGILLPIMAYLW